MGFAGGNLQRREDQDHRKQENIPSGENTELRARANVLFGVENRKHNSFFIIRKIMMRSQGDGDHPPDAENGFMMAAGKMRVNTYWTLS